MLVLDEWSTVENRTQSLLDGLWKSAVLTPSRLPTDTSLATAFPACSSVSAADSFQDTSSDSLGQSPHHSYIARPVLTGPVLTRNLVNFAKFG